MPQRWMKFLAFITIAPLLFSACRKSEFSKDEKLPESFSSSLFVISQNQFLNALDPVTGVKKWEYFVARYMEASPVIVGDYMYLATSDSLIKIDAKRGKEIKKYWFPYAKFTSFFSTPVVQGDIIFLGSANDTMYAFNTTSENIKWKFNAGDDITSSPTVSGGQIFFGTPGKFYALDAETGNQNWVFSTGQFLSSATVVDQDVYVGNNDGNLYVLDAATGNTRWSYQTGAQVQSSPIAYAGNIIFGSNNGKVYCLDTILHKERWIFNTGDRVICSAAADGNVIYIGSYDYYLYAINMLDGKEKWKYQTNALVKASPVVHNGIVYFGGFDKTMYAFDSSGVLQWKNNVDGLIESSPILWDLEKTFYPSISGNSKY